MLTEQPTNDIVEDTHFDDLLTESPQKPVIGAMEEH
mgnify:CR=1 FL=1